MLVGLFVMVAIGLIVGIILFIQPSVGDGKQTLTVRFSNVNGINVGTRVLFAGKPVGEVTKLETIPNARQQPVDELGQVFYYQLVLHLDSHVKVYTTDEITVATSGLLGEKSVAIVPKTPPKGVNPQLATASTPLYADSADPFQTAFHQISTLADTMEDTFAKVNVWIDDNGQSLGQAVKSFDDAMVQFADALATVNQTGLVQNVKDGVLAFTDTAQEISDAICEMRERDVFVNLGATLANVRGITWSVDKITHQISKGKGTIGRLLMGDDMYLQLTSIFSKVDTLMNDVNHYGLLFNLNKEWQRTRTKRATLLNALKTPENFKNYFEEEVDTINTSMARISMLIDKAENAPDTQDVLQSRLFRKDFAELLRLVNELLDNLTLYNEQLDHASGCE